MIEWGGIILATSAALSLALSTIRWIRVAQREHYIPGWTNRIARVWIRKHPLGRISLALPALVAGGTGAVFVAADSAVVVAMGTLATSWLAAAWPWGLGFRGRTSALQWTDRAKRLAVIFALVWLPVFAVLIAVVVVAGPLAWVSASVVGFALARLAPIAMDVALVIAKPIERTLSRKWIVAAQKKLRHVRPQVIAVTGSYGKTTTKGYIAHLVSSRFSVVPSPASFNNLLGLSRAVNDKLTPGTEVFVAEMGMFGEGEIRELSRSFPPDIAAITVIGEAHRERLGSREAILRAKSEIVENAQRVVLPIDDPDLAALADRCQAEGKRVVRVSATGAAADVSVDPRVGRVTIGSESAKVSVPSVGHAVNIAVAVGIAHALAIPLPAMESRLGDWPTAAHRAEPQHTPRGAVVIDDSYNSNPTGAARAVEAGSEMATSRKGPFIVVTPGMIELGDVQAERNRAFASQIHEAGGELYIVGFTNRTALESGHPGSQWFANRPKAMSTALDRAGASGVILVENDLPDHYA